MAVVLLVIISAASGYRLEISPSGLTFENGVSGIPNTNLISPPYEQRGDVHDRPPAPQAGLGEPRGVTKLLHEIFGD